MSWAHRRVVLNIINNLFKKNVSIKRRKGNNRKHMVCGGRVENDKDKVRKVMINKGENLCKE